MKIRPTSSRLINQMERQPWFKLIDKLVTLPLPPFSRISMVVPSGLCRLRPLISYNSSS